MENPCKHPTIILPQEVGFSDLKFIIDFVYRGEIDVSQAQLQVCIILNLYFQHAKINNSSFLLPLEDERP